MTANANDWLELSRLRRLQERLRRDPPSAGFEPVAFEARCIPAQWTHHSEHSSYDRLVTSVAQAISIVDTTKLRTKIVPGRIAVRLAMRSGVKQYSHLEFYKELSAALEAIRLRPKHLVVHVVSGDHGLRYLGLMGKILRFSVVATLHEPPSLLETFIVNKSHLRYLDAVIVVSRNQIEFLQDVVPKSKVCWVPIAVDTSVFRPSDVIQKGSTQNTCVFVGEHLRDFDTLVNVIRWVQSVREDVRFVLVVQESRRSQFEHLSTAEVKSRISETELIQIYQKSGLMIQPMIDSTANTAIVEAMACGLPIVASNVGGVVDYLGEDAALVPPGDVRAMAESVLTLLSDREQLERMGHALRVRSLAFDRAVVSRQLLKVYESVALPKIRRER